MLDLHHIAISTKNTERLIIFYKKLGFSFLKEYLDKDLRITWISNGQFIIEIFEYKTAIEKEQFNIENDLQRTGLKHFAFSVENIFHFYKKISLVLVVGEIKDGRMGSRYFFIEDPDGNFIEFIEK